MNTSDSELALQAGNGDSAAFQVLLERHYDGIYRIAYRFTGVREDAEDIAQAVCTSLAVKLRSFKGEARFTTWLYRIVVNAAQDLRRRQGATSRLHAAYGEVSELMRGAEADAARELNWLYDALQRVGQDLRETAVLVLAEGLTHAEAADILEIKESTVSWRMHELRKELKAMVKAEA
ncbi:RNA polymerase sigma factor [Denitrobaculum tricleocarpae]|uniref:RNA polymerase sigma factor n=1 Tax=Denitrobaculum tricleocarpae TaxID=2591009 RepID=A0A545U124_9PROT|nr:RNA polymerase sigma factor [Denitrobaculum tricleocarpae]TQV83180.1 RNA polymerase sigma factor [Denitrobaculum tricleocarpae]